ncbi:MAG: glycosyltransferase [SAR202 cluster bacterium]|nr:glycosyltransferase [SAR202 cluster bacterium]
MPLAAHGAARAVVFGERGPSTRAREPDNVALVAPRAPERQRPGQTNVATASPGTSTDAAPPRGPLRIAIFSPYLEHIGEAKAMPVLARALASRGHAVDLLRVWKEWQEVEQAPPVPGVRVVSLGARRFLPVLPSIARVSKWASYRLQALLLSLAMMPGFIGYLRRERPDVVIGRMFTMPAVMGNSLARSRACLILSMAGQPRSSAYRDFLWPRVYPRAQGFTAPTAGVAQMASKLARLDIDRFRIIPNPVIDGSIFALASEPVDDPWFAGKQVPVVLGVGRLTRQKDMATLIRAFAAVRRRRPARLLILGEGEDRPALTALVARLGIADDVRMPGFEPNPFKFMKTADLFVMTSRWEGPGHALIEAQAVGTPAISTDCPSGPADTLLLGEAGILVPVGDVDALAAAIAHALDHPEEMRRKAEVGQRASSRFTPDRVAAEWDAFLGEMLARHG